MKTDLLLPDLLALMEIVNEHIDRNFPGGESPGVLKRLQMKLGHMAGMYENDSRPARTRSRPIPDNSRRSAPQKSPEGRARRRSSKSASA